jgi:hypothetical protein
MCQCAVRISFLKRKETEGGGKKELMQEMEAVNDVRCCSESWCCGDGSASSCREGGGTLRFCFDDLSLQVLRPRD